MNSLFVREHERDVAELLEENDLARLREMRRKMRATIKTADTDRESELLEYRLERLIEAIRRAEAT